MYHKNMIKKILFFSLVILVAFGWRQISWADEIEDIQKQIDSLSRQLEMSRQATRPLESTLNKLNSQIATIRKEISGITNQLKKEELAIKRLELSISQKQETIDKQEQQLRTQINYHYRLSRSISPLGLVFNQGLNQQTLSILALEEKIMLSFQNKIQNLSANIVSIKKTKIEIQKRKKDLATKQKKLAALRAQLDKQANFFAKEIKGAKAYQAMLKNKITELSLRQKQLLAAKTGLFSTSVGDVPLSGDPHARVDYDPGFRPAFAAFSFGAPHQKGMSQYGAYGRAKKGQNYEQILKAYYGNVRIETVDTNFSISTDQGVKPFEDNYLKGIAEMPTKWADDGGFEALKAQAIAARSYALAYTGWRMNSRSLKKSICTSENCQVYHSSKAANPGRWGDAVNETRGKILVSNNSNEVVNSWYASTSGGYQKSYTSLGHSTPGFWDTECGNQNCWTPDAYEKIAGSPWFYKGWYKTRGGKSCGRSHPWLTQDEMADIINAAIVLTNNQGDKPHIYQLDSCFGSNPDVWDKNRMRQEADKYGGAVSQINGVKVTYSTGGYTNQVTFSTDKGDKTFDGGLFKLVFNLRAPGAIHIKSRLYNIEKK